jgi:hypothetical protein
VIVSVSDVLSFFLLFLLVESFFCHCDAAAVALDGCLFCTKILCVIIISLLVLVLVLRGRSLSGLMRLRYCRGFSGRKLSLLVCVKLAFCLL